MINSFSKQDYSSFTKLFSNDNYPKSSKLLNYTSNSFQTLSYVQPINHKIHKKYSSNLLTDFKFGLKNLENDDHPMAIPNELNINTSVISNLNILEGINNHNKIKTDFNFTDSLYTSENIDYSLNPSQVINNGKIGFSNLDLNPHIPHMNKINVKEKYPKYYYHKKNHVKTPAMSFLKKKYSGLEINSLRLATNYLFGLGQST